MPDTPDAGPSSLVGGGIAAPVVYFETVSAFGVGAGIGRMTLEMEIYEPTEPGAPSRTRRRVVAHLRGPLPAFDALRSAINQIEAMLTPPAGERPN
ncbi:hypothetical protein MKL09_11900 [Methylobacterium sp. J-048]|uniref:hypothetical protein n=1 Tax=Methylobacterium sp. J-048 TaxID=2836635 RepID=UPI001FB8D18D|nr:hypothetical protein [Methylobacterium sp. J-048]MCJ2057257.1 hypothetical protein [Methylobacterium sp. J-048]